MKTAFLSGASEGLGKALALELAARNVNLILTALPGTGLPALSSYIRLNFGVRVWYFEADLTQNNACENIFKEMQKLNIRANMLINNAGLGNWSWFAEKDRTFYKTQIDLNITSAVMLTRLFLDHRKPDTATYILNVGSLGGHFIVPKKPVYGATKSFIAYFTRSLQLEHAGTNVHVSLLSPGGINTKPELLILNHRLRGLAKASILEPEAVAKAAVNGLLKGKKEIIPGRINRLIALIGRLLPGFIKAIIIRRRLKMMLQNQL